MLFMARINAFIMRDSNKFEYGGKEIKYTVSIGGAVFPLDASSIDKLVHSADMALLKAKDDGRNCFRIYQPEYEGRDKT
jgi:GGDEF domain-containing protein